MTVFAATGLVLFWLAKGEERAKDLSVLNLLIALTYANNMVQLSGNEWWISSVIAHAPVDAFVPYFAWRFFSNFPATVDSTLVHKLFAIFRSASLIAGVLLFSHTAIPTFAEILPWFSRSNPTSLYWAVVYGLLTVALLSAVLRVRRAPAEEQDRVKLMTLGLALTGIPVAVYILLLLTPSFQSIAYEPDVLAITVPAVSLTVIAIPLIMAYATLVERAIPTPQTLSNSVRAAFGRSLLILAPLFPFLYLGWFLWDQRSHTLESLVLGYQLYVLLALLLFFIFIYRIYVVAVGRIRTLLFRGKIDIGEAWQQLQTAIDGTDSKNRTFQELASLIERHAQLSTVVLLTVDRESTTLMDTTNRVPPLISERLIKGDLKGPLLIDENSVQKLTSTEQEWFVNSKICGVSPLIDTDQGMVGLLAFGQKKSGTAFQRSELIAINLLCNTLADRFTRLIGEAGGTASNSATRAYICHVCKMVAPKVQSLCIHCGGELEDSGLPLNIRGRYRLESVVGKGASGVVFKAFEIPLSRYVAIKTLPRDIPGGSLRLRHEATALAAVRHESLETIYGIESFEGIPLLVLELMHNGTLESRVAKDPLPLRKVIDLGARLCDGLQQLHSNGIIHRDIKPANIGFTDSDVPKLLDFGLSKYQNREVPDAYGEYLSGTLPYTAPSVISGSAHDQRSDLWALSVTLYEALTQENPFAGVDLRETLQNIISHPQFDPSTTLSTYPRSVTEFFSRALGQSWSEEFETSEYYKQALIRLL